MAFYCPRCKNIVYTAQQKTERMRHSELEDGQIQYEEWTYRECPICGGTDVKYAGECEACGEPCDPTQVFCPECQEHALKRFRSGIETILRQIRIDTGCTEYTAQELLDWCVEKEGI